MSGIETGGQEPAFAAFVGIDWADQKHVWCLQGQDSTKRESGELEHTPEAVEAWVAQLCQRFGNRLLLCHLRLPPRDVAQINLLRGRRFLDGSRWARPF